MRTEQQIIDFAVSGSKELRDASSAEAAQSFPNDRTMQTVVENIFKAGWNYAMAAVIDFIAKER